MYCVALGFRFALKIISTKQTEINKQALTIINIIIGK